MACIHCTALCYFAKRASPTSLDYNLILRYFCADRSLTFAPLSSYSPTLTDRRLLSLSRLDWVSFVTNFYHSRRRERRAAVSPSAVSRVQDGSEGGQFHS